MTTLTTSDAHLSAFRDWLNKYPTTAVSKRPTEIASMRKFIMRSILAVYKADKVNQLPVEAQDVIAGALGITVPGPIKPLSELFDEEFPEPVEDFAEIGTAAHEAIERDLSKPSRPYTPGERQAIAERPAINAEGRMTMNGPIPFVRNGMTEPPRSRIEEMREQMKAKAVSKYKAESDADKRGDLFTVVAAYKPESTFLVIFQGRMDDEWHDAFQSQHTEAHMFLERSYMIAERGGFAALRAEAIRTHTGKSKADVTVRVILKPTN